MTATELTTRPWPLWRKVLAYAILSALALTAIWLVDRKVMGLRQVPPVEPQRTTTPPADGKVPAPLAE